MNLRFRQIKDSDLDMLLKWRTMPEVSAYMYTDIEPDMAKQKQWYERIRSDKTRRDWIIVVDGEDVGLVSVVRIDQTNKRCEWAYYLASPSVRGKGIGRSVEMNILDYVFNKLKLHKLCCEVFVANDIVIKIHEKYGSRVEGTRREHIHKNSEYHDIVEMGILKEEYENNIKGKFEYVEAEFEPSEEVVSA